MALCLSVACQCSLNADGRTDPVFGVEASFDLSCMVS